MSEQLGDDDDVVAIARQVGAAASSPWMLTRLARLAPGNAPISTGAQWYLGLCVRRERRVTTYLRLRPGHPLPGPLRTHHQVSPHCHGPQALPGGITVSLWSRVPTTWARVAGPPSSKALFNSGRQYNVDWRRAILCSSGEITPKAPG